MTPERCLSSDESVAVVGQIQHPCADCPWAKTSLPGWLGGVSVEEWLRRATSDRVIECHVFRKHQCAGLAIYRRNTCKRVEPPVLVLPADREAVFATPMAFAEHHGEAGMREFWHKT